MTPAEQSAANVRALKERAPQIFLEWHGLKAAERDLDAAKERYDRALAAWERVGNE